MVPETHATETGQSHRSRKEITLCWSTILTDRTAQAKLSDDPMHEAGDCGRIDTSADRIVQNHPTLYRRSLGQGFDALPTVLRDFHDLPFGGMAQGVLLVTRGKGLLRQIMAGLMRLPKPGDEVPVFLEVRVQDDTEWWIRNFASHRIVTRQWLEDGLLIEAAGPLRFGFRMAADPAGMRFEFARCWISSLPVPLALSPRVNASAAEYEDGWWVRVSVEVPILGLLTQYEGKMAPRC